MLAHVIVLSMLFTLVCCEVTTIRTLAGGESLFVADNIQANSSLIQPKCAVFDKETGLVYLCSGNRVLIYNPSSGLLYTFAGTMQAGYNGDGILATTAQLKTPSGVAIDNNNNLVYIVDKGNHRVRVVNQTNNIISTFAGTGTSGFKDNVIAASAPLNSPSAVAVDDSLVYIADSNNARIRVVNTTIGNITTFAGNGQSGSNGDNLVATASWIYNPSGIVVDSANNVVYFSDTSNNYLRMVNRTTGKMSIVAGGGSSFSNNVAAKTARLNNPIHVTIGPNNTILFADTSNNCIRKVDKGTCALGSGGYAGDNGPVSSASLSAPNGVAIDVNNNIVYVADTNNNRVRTIRSGIISTSVGTGYLSYYGDGTNVLANVRFNGPAGMLLDNNILYVADQSNYRVRALNLATNVTTSITGTGITGSSGDGGDAASAQMTYPRGLAIYNDLFLIADYSGNRIRAINHTTNVITTLAGAGSVTDDNSAFAVTRLFSPSSLTTDYPNNIVIYADTLNNRIRILNFTSGNISTLAGTGTGNYNGDNIAATKANLQSPIGVALDSLNNIVYIADYNNHRIRAVNRTSGNITTVAGTGQSGYNGDNIAATSARLFGPAGVAVDTVNNILYIADASNQRIRVVNLTTGNITTLAGTGTQGFNGDNIDPQTAYSK
ncbi:NHL repeat-containing protein [Acrasis kona]|uniref:NHL repeat-containing protein n=1 Tax=Acrasis kona TaxID=1008807 RepID=A0AAW2YWX4_9EUKA